MVVLVLVDVFETAKPSYLENYYHEREINGGDLRFCLNVFKDLEMFREKDLTHSEQEKIGVSLKKQP
jgi:hypothetical protein